MTATNFTEHYNLSQFVNTDRPTFTGDYNGDMSKIDAAIYAASQSGSGMATVEHTADLTGDGSADNPLGVADTIARTESVTQAIAAAIADRLTAGDIKSGTGINIKTSGNQVTISYVGGGLSAVSHDDTITGAGTPTAPLGVADGTMITPSHATYEKAVDFNDITACGVYDVRTGPGTANRPVNASLNGAMLVIPAGYNESVFQIVFSRDTDLSVFIRAFASFTSTWTGWDKIAFMSDIPDVSALTSRISALESQVAALSEPATPSATGLAAEQLDSR